MNYLKVIFGCTFILCMLQFNALDGQDDKVYGGVKQSKANQLYENKGYKASILEYLKMDNISIEDKLKIANAYRLVHETENAELWYEQVLSSIDLNEINDPIHLLYYAQVLQSNGKENHSSKYYEAYTKALKTNEKWDNIAHIFSQSVTLTGRFPHTELELQNERYINTAKLEFSPTIYDNGIVYVTTQTSNKLEKQGKDKWLNENYMSLMSAQKGENNLLQAPSIFSTELTGMYHEGPVAFSNSNTRIYFTMNNAEKIKSNTPKTVRKLQIYSSKWTGKKWEEPKLLNFNTDENEEAHPTLSPDGNTMYFASNRPGGHGGMDIYETQWVNGKWTKPRNLGKQVNTPGNEVFPFYHANGMLFFSSNGHDGLGGLDVFHTAQSFNGQWSKAVNAGTPFNSKKDDFGLIMDQEGKFGYLTSAREGGVGRDDIYSFELPEEILEPKTITFCVSDKNTGQFLPNTGIKVLEFDSKFSLDSDGFGEQKNYHIQPTEQGNEFLLVLKTDDLSRQPISFYTDDQGYLEYTIEPGMNYKFVAERDGYKLGELNVSYDEDMVQPEKCILMEEGSNEIVQPSVSTQPYTEQPASYSDPAPRSDVNTAPDTDIRRAEVPIIKEEELPENPIATLAKENLSFLELGSANLKVGNVIVLENIYYDFDQDNIRRDAKPELDKVVRLMEHFPKMVIELGSHTDSRGADSYNESLSSRRAKSAVEYITSNGIESERLVAKGYGEENLRNSCADGRKCSEKAHQYNRRTEIRILEMPYDDVNVSYDEIDGGKGDDEKPNQRITIGGEIISENFFADDEESDDGTNKYHVFAGSYSKRSGAEKKRDKIEAMGFKVSIIERKDLNVFRIIAGEFKSRRQAEIVISALQNAGINARIKTLD